MTTARRSAFLGVAVLSAIGGGLIGYRVLRSSAPNQQASAAGAQPTTARGQARLLLNEVQFLPSPGQSQWVELVNAGGETASLDGLALENHANARFAIAGSSVPPGGVLLVRFDTTFLAGAGFVHLTAGQNRLDRIAWGDGQAGAARLSRGGDQEPLAPGMSLGRVPGSVESDPLEWVSFSPAQATPGRPNPQPGVEILLPMDGAIVTGEAEDLTWYTVAGAARYRVQLSTDRSFGSTLLDQTVEQPPVRAPALGPGTYVWRVQAVGRDGTPTEYSTPSTLTVRAIKRPAGRGRALLDRLFPSLHAQAPQAVADEELPIVLDIPMIKQHKDTAMLLIESRRETPGRFGHTWDADHGDLGTWDAADNANCATASIAMLVAHYGGRLSQDRINYEVFKDDAPGPQGDLNFGVGYSDDRKKRAMAFALGREPTIERPDDPIYTAMVVRDRIRAGIPMMGCENGHCVAIVGASATLAVINDPWRGTYLIPMTNILGSRLFVMADHVANRWPVSGRSDEPDVSRDSDGDGLVDFDEIHRFRTNPKVKDTDRDDLPDKEDVRASVQDRRHGFAYGGNGRDFDGDGKAMELDDDSDAGGCLDGWEDQNKNGKFDEGPETDNFARGDDPCVVGKYRKEVNSETQIRHSDGTRDDGKYHELQTTTFSLKRQADGTLAGRANATFEMETIRVMSIRGNCRMRTWVPQAEWSTELRGQARALPDGSVEITFQPPGAQPSIPMHSKDECPPTFSVSNTMPAPFYLPYGPFKLVNGVFKQGGTMPTGHQIGTAELRWELSIEQKGQQQTGSR
jgi:hypothetical protein